MQKPKMYATCDISGNGLKQGKEYRILRVNYYKGFAGLFFTLEDGLKYSEHHFSVTYLK